MPARLLLQEVSGQLLPDVDPRLLLLAPPPWPPPLLAFSRPANARGVSRGPCRSCVACSISRRLSRRAASRNWIPPRSGLWPSQKRYSSNSCHGSGICGLRCGEGICNVVVKQLQCTGTAALSCTTPYTPYLQCRLRLPQRLHRRRWQDGRRAQRVQKAGKGPQLAAQAVPHRHALTKVRPGACAGRQRGQPRQAAVGKRQRVWGGAASHLRSWCCDHTAQLRLLPPTQALALLPPERLGSRHSLEHGLAAEGQSHDGPQARTGGGGGGGGRGSCGSCRRWAGWVHHVIQNHGDDRVRQMGQRKGHKFLARLKHAAAAFVVLLRPSPDRDRWVLG